jgi:hypothetical protein
MAISRRIPTPAPIPSTTPTAAPSVLAPAPAHDQQAGELITPAAAADRLSVTAKVLERWRGTGDGPAFVRLTSKTIRYRPTDIDAFVAVHMRASTAIG